MPGGDRTGPLGLGPATGRGAGYCRGLGSPGFANWSGGRRGGAGFGRGGYGRGWRNQFFATGLPGWVRGRDETGRSAVPSEPARTPTRELQQVQLEARLQDLQREVEEINRQLAEPRSRGDS